MKKNHFLIITAIFLFYAANNFIWLSLHKLPVSYDEGVHLWMNLRFVKAFIYPAHDILYDLMHANITQWPPLFHLTAGIFNLAFGNSYTVSVMTNMLFFLLLIVSLYFIGKKIYGPSCGILAVAILSLYPIVYGHSRLFLLDFALMSIVTSSIYCLLSTDGFKDLYWSVIFGVSAGLGMLIKWSYAFFVMPLILYVVITGFYGAGNREFLKRAKNLLIAAAVSFFISSAWYLMNMNKSGSLFRELIDLIGKNDWHIGETAQWFILTFNNNMVSFPFFLLLIIGLAVFYLRSDSRFKLFITIWYIVPLTALWYMIPLFEISFQLYIEEWKQARYFMPLLPCFALISAMGLEVMFKSRKIKNAVLCFIFSAGLFQYYGSSFNSAIYNEIDKHGKMPKEINVAHKVWVDSFDITGSAPPYTINWKHADIARVFAGEISKQTGYPLLAGIIIDDEEGMGLKKIFGNKIMNYYFAKEFVSSGAEPGPEIFLDLKEPGREREWQGENKRFLEALPYLTGVLYVSRENEWPVLNDLRYLFNNRETDKRLVDLINGKQRFRLLGRIPLPKGYYANMYFCNVPEIESGDLTVKMFNGQAKIFYKNKEITKSTGIMPEFAHKGRVYRQTDAELFSYSEGPGEIVMISRWAGLGITQTMMLSVKPDGEGTVNIKARMESDNDTVIDNWYINNLISNDYKEWTRPYSKGVFKKITAYSDPDSFEALDLDYNGPNIIGIEENAGKGLPALLFKSYNEEISGRAGVSNTNYYHNARCIYVTLNSPLRLESKTPKDILSMDIEVLKEKEMDSVVLGRLDLPDGNYLDMKLSRGNAPEIRKGDLRVNVFNGRIKVFFKDKEVIKGMRVAPEFIYDNKVYRQSDAELFIYNDGPRQIRIVSRWGKAGAVQTVTAGISPDRDNTVNIKAELESEKDVIIKNWYVNNFISEKYKEWMRPYSKGMFKEITKGRDTLGPVDALYDGPNLIGIQKNAGQNLPALLFKDKTQDVSLRSSISNTNHLYNSRCVSMNTETKTDLSPGKKKTMLDMDISVLEGGKLEDAVLNRLDLKDGGYVDIKPFSDPVPEIKNGDLAVKVFNGKAKIFYKDKEITKSTGIMPEFICGSKLYRQKDAELFAYNESPERIKIISKWPMPAIIQTTIVTVNKEGAVNIKTSLESEKDITIDSWYINNLISEEYKEWMRPYSKGIFKEITKDSDPDRFEPLDLDYTGPNIIGIRENTEKGRPAVLFKSYDRDIPMSAGVSNTNYYHNARCVYITANSPVKFESNISKDILDMDIIILKDEEFTGF